MIPSKEATQWLGDGSRDHQPSLGQLTPVVYDALRRLARRYLRREGRT